MKISLDWLGDYVAVPASLSVPEIAHELTLRTVEVEGWKDISYNFEDVVVGRVTSSDSDVCVVDLGSSAFEVRCLGLSPSVGNLVGLVGEPGDYELCTYGRLGLSESDSTEIDLTLGDRVEFGVGLGEMLVSNDVVFEIDNKSLTNRPDLWCHEGIAREIAAIFKLQVLDEVSGDGPALGPSTEQLIGAVDRALCNRFSICEIRRNGPMPETPSWMRFRLDRIGEASRGLYPDLTNYVTFAVGQPTHVYDGDKTAGLLSVRKAILGGDPKQRYLNGESVAVRSPGAVIADDSSAIAIAGVVGGASTQCEPGTTRVLLEAGNFSQSAVRSVVLGKVLGSNEVAEASQSLGAKFRTSAAERFEKGIDSQRLEVGRDLFLTLLQQLDPSAEVVGHQVVTHAETPLNDIDVSLSFIRDRLGLALDATQVAELIGPLGFSVAGSDGDGNLLVTAPSWRSTGDVSIKDDVLEEVGRMIGYDNLPHAAPHIQLRLADRQNDLSLERRVAEFLAHDAGMQEVFTYPWSALDRIADFSDFKGDPIEFEGAPSADLRWLRTTLLSNLVSAAEANLKHTSHFRIFELGSVYRAAELSEDTESLPDQPRLVAGLFVGREEKLEFAHAVGAVEGIARSAWSSPFRLEPAVNAWQDLEVLAHGERVGRVWLLPVGTIRTTSGTASIAAFELNLSALSVDEPRPNTYQAVSPYPETLIDISILASDEVYFRDLAELIEDEPLVSKVELLDEYRGAGIATGFRSLTFGLRFSSAEGTLTSEEATGVRDRILERLTGRFGVELR